MMCHKRKWTLPCIAIAIWTVFGAGCGATEQDTEHQFEPCEVVRWEQDEPSTLYQQLHPAWEYERIAKREFWQSGPLPVWNTHPAEGCNQNPVLEQVADASDVEILITYPAQTVPRISGYDDVAEGNWPVIVFAHANDDRVCTIFELYRSLYEHWASWGYVVVAIDGTATNCTPGTRENIEHRIEGQLKALDKLAELNHTPQSRFFERLDLENIVLAGHSRGGGASLISATRLGDEVKAVLTIQGVDVTDFGFGTQPLLPSTPVLGITAGLDTDLRYPLVEPTEDQLAGPYLWADIIGGIHAYTGDSILLMPNDNPEISKDKQQRITGHLTIAFLAHYLGVAAERDDEFIGFSSVKELNSLLFSHENAQLIRDRVSEHGIFARWNQQTDFVIDDFNQLTSQSNLIGGDHICENLLRCENTYTYAPDDSVPARYMWQKPRSRMLVAGEQAGAFRTYLSSDGSPLSFLSESVIQARVKGPDEGHSAKFEVAIETTHGSFSVPGNQFIGPVALSNRFTQLVVPFSAFSESLHPATEITSIAIRVTSGTLFVDDLRVASPSTSFEN